MKSLILRIIPIGIGVMCSKIFFYKTGFKYNIFSDGFDLIKFIIDLAIFTLGYAIAYFPLKYLFKDK